jgi:hypothetical protein
MRLIGREAMVINKNGLCPPNATKAQQYTNRNEILHEGYGLSYLSSNLTGK